MNIEKHKWAYFSLSYSRSNRLSGNTVFFVKLGLRTFIATNWHVVTGLERTTKAFKLRDNLIPDMLGIFLPKHDGSYEMLQFYYHSFDWLELNLGGNILYDISVLEIKIPESAYNITYINLSEPVAQYDVGDICYFIGFPDSHMNPSKISFEGLVIHSTVVAKPEWINIDSPSKFHSKISEVGTSGSPIFNFKGELIGMHCGLYFNIRTQEKVSYFNDVPALIHVIKNGTPIDFKTILI